MAEHEGPPGDLSAQVARLLTPGPGEDGPTVAASRGPEWEALAMAVGDLSAAGRLAFLADCDRVFSSARPAAVKHRLMHVLFQFPFLMWGNVALVVIRGRGLPSQPTAEVAAGYARHVADWLAAGHCDCGGCGPFFLDDALLAAPPAAVAAILRRVSDPMVGVAELSLPLHRLVLSPDWGDPDYRQAVGLAMRRFGVAADLDRPDDELARAAADRLGELARSSDPADPAVFTDAVRGGYVTPSDALATLGTLIRSPDGWVRTQAYGAVGRLGSAAAPLLDRLVDCVRAEAAGELNPPTPPPLSRAQIDERVRVGDMDRLTFALEEDAEFAIVEDRFDLPPLPPGQRYDNLDLNCACVALAHVGYDGAAALLRLAVDGSGELAAAALSKVEAALSGLWFGRPDPFTPAELLDLRTLVDRIGDRPEADVRSAADQLRAAIDRGPTR